MVTRLSVMVFVSGFTAAAAACASSGEQPPSSRAAQSGYVEVPGGRLWFETAGSGDPLVLIHGNAGDRRHWDHQLWPLAREYRVIRYDVRGYGNSTVPVEGAPYASHEDLAALLDHLRIAKAHIAGWSMGCGIAIDFVLAYPERAASLIAVGPWVSGYSSPAAEKLRADLTAVASAASQQGTQAAVDAWMHAPFFAATVHDSLAGAEFARIASDYSWWAFSHTSPQRSLEPAAIDRLGTIKAPTLIMTAEHDILACREVADLLDSSVPKSRKVVVAGAGHLLHMEKPEEFNQTLIAFIRSQSSQ
jgi:pimeloyl-ACP methyl ester carboxylesterase